MFHLQQSRYLRFYTAQQSSLPFNLFTIYPPTHKKYNHKKNHTYVNLVYSICQRADIYSLVKLLFPSLFLVNSPPSTTTLRFSYSSLMNISPGKYNKFPISSIWIPSSSSSTVATLFDWGVSSSMKTWFSWKIKLEHLLFAKEVSYILFHVMISLCFTSSVKTFVNEVNNWLIKINGFLIGEVIFVLNTDWRRNNWMVITHFKKS